MTPTVLYAQLFTVSDKKVRELISVCTHGDEFEGDKTEFVSVPGVSEIFRTLPDRSWGPPSLL
jgi:hypothetical protein